METAYIATGEILVYIACLLAAIGAFLPVLPGPLLSFAAILVFKLVFPESGVGWLNVWICGFLAAFAQLADIFMSWLGAKKFGAVISCGKLFAGLEMLPGVVRVQELNLERIGNAAEKDDRGDLHLHEDALCYLEKIELEFV